MRLGLHILAALFTHQRDGNLDQIADDLLHVAADIADFGELGRFHLDERCTSEPGETAGNLRLADAGRSDHQYVLRHDLFAHLAFELLAAPAIAQRNGDGALGVVLADNEAVEFRDDFTGRSYS